MARLITQKPRATAEPTETVHGLRAGLAVFARRRADIVRIAYGRDNRREVADLARWANSGGVPCVEMTDGDLDRFGGSNQHEGLCLMTRPRRWLSTSELVEVLARGGTAVALDRVRNPYNVGAVMRSAAFFGVDAALLGAPAPHPGLAPLAVRVAEGGVEHLKLARTTDLAATLARLHAHRIQVVGADGWAAASATAFVFARPAVLVLGNEREGLGDRVRAECDACIAIPGSGAVESLNIAVAAGVLIAKMVQMQKSSAAERS